MPSSCAGEARRSPGSRETSSSSASTAPRPVSAGSRSMSRPGCRPRSSSTARSTSCRCATAARTSAGAAPRAPVTRSSTPRASGGLGLMRSFDGLLVTCGLDHAGLPAVADASYLRYPPRAEIVHPLHGRLPTSGVTLTGYGVDVEGRGCAWATADVHQAGVFTECLTLHRRVEIELERPVPRVTALWRAYQSGVFALGIEPQTDPAGGAGTLEPGERRRYSPELELERGGGSAGRLTRRSGCSPGTPAGSGSCRSVPGPHRRWRAPAGRSPRAPRPGRSDRWWRP